MNRTHLFLAVAAIALSVACGGSAGDSASPTAIGASPTAAAPESCVPTLPRTPGDATETMQSGGVERTYIVHVPPGYAGSRRTPMVLGFHSLAQFAEGFAAYTELAAATDAAGYLLVMPNGTGVPQRWNSRESAEGAADAAFVDDLMTRLDQQVCVDPTRTYAAGFSNGGGMAMLAACKRSERFASIAVVAATYVGCTADVPLIAFHGTADPVVPFDGGVNPPERGGGVFPPVRRSLSEWARAGGCDGLPIISKIDTDIELSTFVACTNGEGNTLLYSVIGGGHSWPGAVALPENIVGTTTSRIDASQMIVDFFELHRR